MYILVCNQDGKELEVAGFENLSEGRACLEQLAAYHYEEDKDIEEWLDPAELPDYQELDCHGYLLPFSRLMFSPSSTIEVEWRELPYLAHQGVGIVEGTTKIDAYSVENQEVKDYILKREDTYQKIQAYFKEKGFETKRDFLGSEDGEAILVRKLHHKGWQFLTHLDPTLDAGSDSLAQLSEWVEEEESV